MRILSLLIFGPVVALSLHSQSRLDLGGIAYRPEHSAVKGRRALTFDYDLPNPVPHGLGQIRREEIDAVPRDPYLALVGVERTLDGTLSESGIWTVRPDGRDVYRLSIQSDGAAALRLRFSSFALGHGEAWLYSPDHEEVFGPYTGSGLDGAGGFWSHTLHSDTAILEFYPYETQREVPFKLAKVAHMFAQPQAPVAGACELDITCYPEFSQASSGVGMYTFQKDGGTYQCTGALMNNTLQDLKPYFLTANHCISDNSAAQTMEVFWKYQTASCNGAPPLLSSLPTTIGATYLVGAPLGSGDYSLLLLNPLPDTPLFLYGWDARDGAFQIGGYAAGVHHPAAGYKRISFGMRVADAAAQVDTDIAPAAKYYRVTYTGGRVEPGSSGSPLFNQSQAIVGTLSYGPTGDVCSSASSTAGYGRFSVAYPALSHYLAPTGATSLGVTPTPSRVILTATPSTIQWSWAVGQADLQSVLQVTSTSQTNVTVEVSTTATWIALSTDTLIVSSSRPASLAISLSTNALATPGLYKGTVILVGPDDVKQSVVIQATVTASAIGPPASGYGCPARRGGCRTGHDRHIVVPHF